MAILDFPDEGLPALLARVAAKEQQAFGEISRRFWAKMCAIVRYRLRHKPELKDECDVEDVLQSVLRLFWIQVLAGNFSEYGGEDEFWRLFRTMVARRIMSKGERVDAIKRGGCGKLRDHLSWERTGCDIADDLNLFECEVPSADLLAAADDEYRWLLGLLGPELRRIAEARFDGYTIEKIARHRGRSTRTIERMVEQIREIWRDARSAGPGE